eukprot:CAMPEP_0196595880 /NCGR_PEP_ID=MMETSP1081-20130531/82988_1 /TAXON_ID=36882 /ORGANISM="Pyramimonas amylifera, Strain CCMP720" /LENGTH=219 /DNA_ID=CAMNT_0041920655 /DNA_START=95 /DNA_END=754 /DNA_ORIENTATION=+
MACHSTQTRAVNKTVSMLKSNRSITPIQYKKQLYLKQQIVSRSGYVYLASDSEQETVSTSVAEGNVVEEVRKSVYYRDDNKCDDITHSMNVLQSGRASEIINGRVAMVGFTAALVNELSSGNSLMNQLWDVQEYVNSEGVQEFFISPDIGIFLIPATVMLIVTASFLPGVCGRSDNGLDVPAKPFGPFNPSSEMTNGRAAMMGLVALTLAEAITGSAFF